MKTKRTVFEVNDVYRVMENSELIYTLTNSEKLKREEYKYEQMEMDGLYLSDVLETLTPNRKKVAYAAIELYKRLKEGQIERPALLDSNKREFEIKSKNSKLSVIDKLYVNGGLLFKKAVCRDSRQGVGYKVTE